MRKSELILRALRISFLRTDEIAELASLSEDDTELELLSLKTLGMVSSHSHGSTVWWSLTKAAKAADKEERPVHDNSTFTLKPPQLKEFRRFNKRAVKQENEEKELEKSWVDWSSQISQAKEEVKKKPKA